MLPSFRLIAATFLCGFLVVFAGLRLATSLNVIHENLPVMAAHAAPMPVAPAADREARRGVSSVPVMYDLRFAANPVSPALVRNAPTAIDRALPLLPLAILPPDLVPDLAPDIVPLAPAETQAPESEMAIAALAPGAPAEALPSITPEPSPVIVVEPLPPLATEAPAPATPAPEARTAAIDPQSSPAPEAAPAEPPADEPDSTASIEAPAPAATAHETANVPLPLVKPQQAGVAPKAAVKPKPRKPRVRAAQRPASSNSFDINNPATSPFGGPQR